MVRHGRKPKSPATSADERCDDTREISYQSINQSISQSVNQTIKQSNNQTMKQ